ncbi:MAG TPA: hypothetical protein VND93_03060 [Myxococcales bacterium]|jgi:hypothetical protein|nr:hypothetical protein [Myxococcales bacterium]
MPPQLSALLAVALPVAAVIAVIAAIRRMRTASGRVRRGNCEACGLYAPVMQATYHQNTGMLVMRQHRRAQGAFCRRCHTSLFWKMTLHTTILGWWGTISLIVTPFFILNNVGLFLAAQTLPSSGRVAADLLEQKRDYALNLLATKDLVTVVEVLQRDTGASQDQVLEFVEKLKQAG